MPSKNKSIRPSCRESRVCLMCARYSAARAHPGNGNNFGSSALNPRNRGILVNQNNVPLLRWHQALFGKHPNSECPAPCVPSISPFPVQIGVPFVCNPRTAGHVPFPPGNGRTCRMRGGPGCRWFPRGLAAREGHDSIADCPWEGTGQPASARHSPPFGCPCRCKR